MHVISGFRIFFSAFCVFTIPSRRQSNKVNRRHNASLKPANVTETLSKRRFLPAYNIPIKEFRQTIMFQGALIGVTGVATCM